LLRAQNLKNPLGAALPSSPYFSFKHNGNSLPIIIITIINPHHQWQELKARNDDVNYNGC